MTSVPAGGTVGILGGGQLGRMLAMAAARLGIKTHIYAPESSPCAAEVAAHLTTARYEDEDALSLFAQSVDAITTEFENIPAQTIRYLAEQKPTFPDDKALSVAQDRVTEKSFLNEAGIETAPWRQVDTADDLKNALAEIGPDTILKTRRFGYDGKGQLRCSARTDPIEAIDAISGAPAILEGLVPFQCEISVIVVRARNGEIRCYDPGENTHHNGILHRTNVPATNISDPTRTTAVETARKIVDGLNYVGVMGVECFVLSDGGVLVNEVAPRVHNTGHWTLEGCAISQFENHIRAVCGWPLGTTERHSNAQMVNLIGTDIEGSTQLAARDNTALHNYNKGDAREGRKMGHYTVISSKNGSGHSEA